MKQDICWKQRFDNYDRAFILLQSALEERSLDDFSDLEQQGLVQRFEFSFEHAWKTMKDFLAASGIQINPVTPKAVIKEAFAAKIIDDGQIWIDMMLDRNLLSHSYDQKTFLKALNSVKSVYLPKLEQLHRWMLEKYQES
ncbi:MAG TPA: nucleotidyltransferase substrate binding protein [Chlorobaculum sp.]|nr:nucleotidyltransferase substrate binding protein [Chlorobaculum sp.]